MSVLKSAVVVSAALVAVGSAVVPAAPAAADPIPVGGCVFAGQGPAALRPVLDALAAKVRVNGQQVLCDVGQSGTVPTLRPSTCSTYATATAGRAALLQSLAAFDGCLQYAWSSTLDLSPAPTQLSYIPFGNDAVTYAITDNSNLPRTLTIADLKAIYTCDPGYVGAGPAYTLHPLLPTPGSGVRSTFAAALGITDADVVAGKYGCVRDTINGNPIADNDGRGLPDNALVPYSATAYAAQLNGTAVDHRASAVTGVIDGKAPLTNADLSGSASAPRYLVVPTASLVASPGKDVFAGPDSLVCLESALIKSFGFAFGATCGDTSQHTT